MPVHTVHSSCSESNDGRKLVEMDSHADTCVVSSNILVTHDHACYVDVYGFDKETNHSNAYTVDGAIVYKDPVMHSTVIIMINHATKIDSLINIYCPMQCQVHDAVVNKCPKFLSPTQQKRWVYDFKF